MSIQRYEQSLDGVWRFLADQELAGMDARWWDGTRWDDAEEAVVPGHWSTWCSTDAGIGWLFHRFDWTPPEGEHAAELRIEGLGLDAEVWLNGAHLGAHLSPLVPANFDVTSHLTPGENLLAARLCAPDDTPPRRDPRAPLAEAVSPRRMSGLLGGALLRVLPATHIQDVHVQPDCRRSQLNVSVRATGGGAVRVSVLDTSYTAEGPGPALTVEMEKNSVWSLASPKVYTLRCELMEGGVCADTVDTVFGMSEFTVKDGRFSFNNRSLWLKGVQHEVTYPLQLPRDAWAAEARRELESARKAGFNLVYLRGGLAPEETLNAADALGMLIAIEAPSGDTALLEALVRHARNHPCVAFWCAASPGCLGAALDIASRFAAIRALDPVRPILGAPGLAGVAEGAAQLLRPFRDAPEPYEDLQVYQGVPLPVLAENYFRNVGSAGGLCLMSGFGVGGPGGAEDDGARDLLAAAREGFAGHGLERGCGGFEGLLKAGQVLQRSSAAAQIDAVRANPRLAGYLYRQLRDCGGTWAGLLDAAGNEKPAVAAVAEAQRPVRPLIKMAKSNLVPRETVSVRVLLANESRIEGRGELSLQVVGPTNQVLWKKKRGVKLPRHGKLLWEGEVSASGSPGMHKFVVRVLHENRIVAWNSAAFYVATEPESKNVAVHLLDPYGAWGKCTEGRARLESVLAPIHIVPPLANSIRGYPDNDLMQVLAQVRGGAVALIFSPPEDWNELAAHFEEDIRATSIETGGHAIPAWHYAKMHPVFAGLPTRGLMARPYRNVAPSHMFLETSDEDVCGTFFTGGGETAPGWGSTVLVRRHGEGRLVFIHLRILENLGVDPIAEHLFINLLNHFTRRSVPSKSPLAPNVKAVEWLRGERTEGARRWMVLGEFANDGGTAGAGAVHPPEKEVDLDATYPGWYQAVTWRPWYSLAKREYHVDLQAAFAPLSQTYPRQDRAAGYAYAEFVLERRQAAALCLSRWNAVKVWVNGKEVFAAADSPPCGTAVEEVIPVFFRQGRNRLLFKCVKEAGPFGFGLDITGERGETVPLKWWR